MAPLAFTTVAAAVTGSYRLGGVLMAVYVVAEMAGAVPVGRLLDRVGTARGLRVLLGVVALGLTAAAMAAEARVNEAALIALIVIPGLAGGAVAGGFRALLAAIVHERQLTRAVAVDAMILDGVLVAGPVLVAVASLTGPFVPLFAMAGAAAAAASFVPGRVTEPRAEKRPEVPFKACLPWLGCQFTVGLLLSTIEVAPLPLVERLDAPAAAAPGVIGLLCGASIAGSAIYAWRGRDRGPRLFLAGFVAGGTLVAADLGWVGLVAGVVLIGGATGPLVTIASVNLQRLLPENRRSEGFSVSFTVQSCGFGLGSLAVGVLPLWLAPLPGVAAAVSIGWFRRPFPRGARRCDADRSVGRLLALRQQPRSLNHNAEEQGRRR
ncbi:MFS transporter [Amycolatopsis carbonis]|uniref:MFS transporter n=1 Tax=Amycolatopsis carbonis TaxID=715471 RepID=A0A9Y2IP07_9PSEU|nr:MFS transporter [Amycolatopsis sp. 2-15]WIX83870.1 MFS transporter [Amycolatopsis sp. 2-15]